MELPAHLITSIQQGRIILFLGAGASKGAKNHCGEEPPDGSQLATLLSQKFLGGKYNSSSLDVVAELAASEAGSLYEVQEYIRDILEAFEPADFHLKIPTFRWKAIATVNYDRILEKAYLKHDKPLQEPVLFISNNDRVETRMEAKENPLPIIKLHGCVTRTNDTKLPLILTPDQYVTHQQNRNRLYERVKTLGYEFPIVFIGHGLQDPDLRQLLLTLSDLGDGRPRYYMVAPNIQDEVRRMWANKDILSLDATFAEFLDAVDQSIPKNTRVLMEHLTIEHPIERKIKSVESLSESTKAYLQQHMDYVHEDLPTSPNDARAFYKGFDLGWYTIKNNLDVSRGITNKILWNVVVRDESDRPTKVELYVIKSPAGSGKSTALKRIAWEAATKADVVALYYRGFGSLDQEALKDIYRLTKERIFLFIDDAADNVALLDSVISDAKRNSIPLTVITAERKNEWNVACEDRLAGFVSDAFELHRFSEAELHDLLKRLEQHQMLGILEGKTQEEQLHQMNIVMDRQILVVLHEITSGIPFEEILIDEYNSLTPRKAKELYLSVCTLNQLGVKVRAGVISRTYNIPFTKFKDDLFDPLEHVVTVEKHPITGEMLYAARHQEIASIVFERVLVDRADRFSEYVKLLRKLDLSYDTDYIAYKRMINHSTLKKAFTSYEDVLELFHVAEEIAPNDVYLIHQRGIYEMEKRPQNLDEAYRYLKLAKEKSKNNLAVLHSLAELARYKSIDATQNGDEFNTERYRLEARSISDILMQDKQEKPYGRQTLLKIILDELKEELAKENPDERQIENIVKRFERQIEAGLQENPGDQHLLKAEALFRQALDQNDKALLALRKAHQANRHSASVAIRLAKIYESQHSYNEGIMVLRESLESNPSDKHLNYALATLLRKSESTNREVIIHHLYKSFAPRDTNYDAQFWFARYLYEDRDNHRREQAKELFSHLRDARIPFERKRRVRDKIREGRAIKQFTGIVIKNAGDYGFVRVDGVGEDVFAHENNNMEWKDLPRDSRVTFQLGFSLRGPEVVNIQPERF